MARDFADKSAARQWVWDRLVAEGVARFPFPPHGRIPNFAGAEVAAARLLEIEPWKSAATIKCNPDSPQRRLRAEGPPTRRKKPQACRAATSGQRRWLSRTCRDSTASSAARSRSHAMGGAA